MSWVWFRRFLPDQYADQNQECLYSINSRTFSWGYVIQGPLKSIEERLTYQYELRRRNNHDDMVLLVWTWYKPNRNLYIQKCLGVLWYAEDMYETTMKGICLLQTIFNLKVHQTMVWNQGLELPCQSTDRLMNYLANQTASQKTIWLINNLANELSN